jgi:predicted RNase H-like HicB family nuclease
MVRRSLLQSKFRRGDGIIEHMKIKVIVHEAEEGGYWAEVPSIPGCATQGETFEELLQNLYEAIEGCLSVDVSPTQVSAHDRVWEIAV